VFWESIVLAGGFIFGQSGESAVRAYFSGRGILGVLLAFFLQLVIIVSIVIPVEPLQVMAGIAYGTAYGTLICVAAVVCASMVIFTLARRTNIYLQSKKRKAKSEEVTAVIKSSNMGAFAVISLMYTVPVFTYGLVTIIAAMNTNLKWWQYLIISAIGSSISTFIAVFFGHMLVQSDPTVSVILVLSIFLMVIVFMLTKDRIFKRLFRPRKSIDERLNTYEPRKPGGFIIGVCLPYLRRKYIQRRNIRIVDRCCVKELKPPFLVLSTHPSFNDWIYCCYALRPHKVHTLLNRWYFHKRILWRVFPRVGGIPKKLFTPEVTPVKNIFSVVQNNGVVQIFPEGINTVYGAGSPIIPATASLVKKLKIPVVSIVVNGAFLTAPKWSGEENIGRIEVTVDLLFSAEQAESLSKEEILQRIGERLRYDDVKWAKENNVVYKSKDRARHMNRALYLCPNCKSEFKTTAKDNVIACSECSFGAYVDENFGLRALPDSAPPPADITEWYRLQTQTVSDQVQEPGFELRQKCKVRTFNKRGFKVIDAYRGEVSVTRDGVRFAGTELRTGKNKEIFQERGKFTGVSTTAGQGFDFYAGDTWYDFVLENGLQTVKYALAIKAIGETS
ncbi:MAG: VTT domain-containing protein, partial [Firmicutes bacterium]|nr:VTT domain-containing protein [Bacillota bacterium]